MIFQGQTLPVCTFYYLGVTAGGDDFEADIAESVEDDHGVGPDTDPVTRLLGRRTAGVAGSPGAVELGLQRERNQTL